MNQIRWRFMNRRFSFLSSLLLLLWPLLSPAQIQPLDRIVAVVEDDVILASELRDQVDALAGQLQARGSPLPPLYILQRQILERMILHSLQLQLAQKNGIQVDDETLRQALQELAARNNMDLESFRLAIEKQGMRYDRFVENLREEIMLNRLRANMVQSRIEVSEREILHFLETESQLDPSQAVEYHLGHILIATPEAASPETVQRAQRKAEQIAEELRQGLDFHQTAIAMSDGAQALKGGDLGWRTLDAVPTLFVEVVPHMKKGDVEGPLRSPSGFHILKLLDKKGAEKHMVTESHVRHILVKTNELIDDAEAKRRLLLIRQKMEQGEDFAALAEAYSDDTVSAVKGGDLGWITPEVVVPPFAEAMESLRPGEISEPVQTPFGWHIIQVLARKNRDDTLEYRKKQAREAIIRRKTEEETELWLRKLRQESYVEIHLDE